MMIPGDRDDFVLLTVDPGATFLPDHALATCTQAALDGAEDTYIKVVNLLWAMSMMVEIEDSGERMWPHEIAQLIADALRDAHTQALEAVGEDALDEKFTMTAVEVSRVLEQVEADINAKASEEIRRLRVRRNA